MPSSSEDKLVSFFLICGLDAEKPLEAEHFAAAHLSHTEEKPSPLEKSYVASILGIYPRNRNQKSFIPEVLPVLLLGCCAVQEILQLCGNCFPENCSFKIFISLLRYTSASGNPSVPLLVVDDVIAGLKFCTQKWIKEPTFHSFVNIREDGSRVYGGALTVYEPVTSKDVCESMHLLHTLHLEELTQVQQVSQMSSEKNQGVQLSGASVPRGHVLKNHANYQMAQNPGFSHTLPKRGRSQNCKRTSFYDSARDTLYVTKSLCVIVPFPVVHASEHILRALYKLSQNPQQCSLPLESYVYWILHELPMPPPSQSLKLSFNDFSVVCQTPGEEELPFFDYPIVEVFDLLSVEKFLKIYTCVLLEHQILMCSRSLQKLMLVAETFSILLFPFQWQHVYVPILPYSQALFLEAPLPFIMGLLYDDAIPEEIFQTNLCIVDIDTARVELPEDLPNLPDKADWIQELHYILNTYSNSWVKRDRKHEWQAQDKPKRSELVPLPLSDVLQESESLARVTEIARKAGIDIPMENLHEELKSNSCIRSSPYIQGYFWNMRINNAVREIFLNRFIHLFFSYSHFMISNCSDRETFESNRDSTLNFDKTAFLSDQPESHLPFLAAFLETQMFTSFIDSKIFSQWEEPDPNLILFEKRIRDLKLNDAVVRTPTYETCLFSVTEEIISKREESMDYIVPLPHELENFVPKPRVPDGQFPLLNEWVLEESEKQNEQKSPWKQRHKHFKQREHLERSEKTVSARGNPSYRNSYHPGMDPQAAAQNNWKFVETLLREAKTKTKRMMLERLGKEAVELGHSDLSVTGVEENTLVASFCDLLERIWSHGLQKKQGKSALWSHLLAHEECGKVSGASKPMNPQFLSPAYLRNLRKDYGGSTERIVTANLMKAASYICDKFDLSPSWDPVEKSSPAESPTKRSSSRPRSPDPISPLPPLPSHIAYDLKNVLKMTEIKSEIGYTRGFVRLALERKLLHKHLKTLLSNQELLRTLYKRYAFLRCEEEREQFLYHVLSLNAADYRCFTNTFTKTKLQYHVLLVPGGKFSATTSANIWLCLGGTIAQTPIIHVPKNYLQFTFEHRNLGFLSTLRVGHDNSGMAPKWYLEYAIVRNNVTGHTYKFPCGRWLGRGVDDNSIERLLVAELINSQDEPDALNAYYKTPPRTRSPSVPRLGDNTKLRINEVQQNLGEAVNNVVKHFYKSSKQRSNLTQLLCGDSGLISCLEQAFLFGFKSSRLFRQIFPWDYIERVSQWFSELIAEGSVHSEDQKMLMQRHCHLVAKINEISSLGKDGKFSSFMLLGIRDHILSGLLPLMAWTPVTSSMYDEPSFLRTPHYLTFLAQLLSSLNDFEFELEKSLTWGIFL